MPISFHNADIKFSLKHKKRLKEFITWQLKEEGIERFTLRYIFCSDDYLLDLNRKFLGHDYYTDIVTFPLSSDNGKLEAEVYISVERVKENAELLSKLAKKDVIISSELSQAFENEMNRVIFHGVLHLLGYKDKTKLQKKEMRKREDLWLRKLEQ
jgi:probable rRNA maturation factor